MNLPRVGMAGILLLTAACSGARARREIVTASAPAPIGPYAQAVEAGGVLYVAGQVGLDPASGVMVAGGIEAQTRRTLANLAAVLDAAGYRRRDVVQATVYLADLAEFEVMNEAYAAFFGDSRPARATVEVQALPRGARVEITLVAVRSRE